ncbi:helix-turn-helix domain-containing protein [Dinoroseobacter sp. PD6]|uniref:helix-turn-helix domain-containing protein n=1 Tax=Dinoroseobacter sp. PD6 TaxID=3028384 RepID=UPI00237B0681|nr:helix-turn-helix domain-containing protein [Dinoroseobacter sp. PD6]MDD9718619.1 helix-turn-helix domain-containing protein [Dinoroseobacter sp. PD6]
MGQSVKSKEDVSLAKMITSHGGSPQHSFRADRNAAAFESHYFDYQYIFVEFLIGHMIDAVGAFDGDYQEMLVLAVIGQARLGAVRTASSPGSTLPDIEAAKESTNASRIADITNIPRQTVRRKLASLETRGWIERDDAGAYRLVSNGDQSTARRDLAETDRRAIDRVARLVADLATIVEKHEHLIAKSR